MSFQQDQAKHLLTQADYYKYDLSKVSEDKLTWKPHEGTMSALEQLDHLAAATDYFMTRGTGDGDAEFQQKPPSENLEAALARFDESINNAVNAMQSLPDNVLDDQLPTTDGTSSVSRRYLLTVPAFHISYHWGQLCMMQTMWGDDAFHLLNDDSPYAKRYDIAEVKV